MILLSSQGLEIIWTNLIRNHTLISLDIFKASANLTKNIFLIKKCVKKD